MLIGNIEVANISISSKLPAYMFLRKPVLLMADADSDSVITVLNAKCGWRGEYCDLRWLASKVNQISDTEDKKLQEMGLAGFYYAK